MRHLPVLAFMTSLLSFGCGTSATTAGTDVGGKTDATATDTSTAEPGLQCPHPASLPFTLASTGWHTPSTEALAKSLPRNKDEAHDLLGNPGGAWLSTDMAQDASPATGAQILHGRKARTTPDGGLDTTGLPGEWTSVWRAPQGTWTQAGRMLTGSDGTYAMTLPDALAFGPGLHAAYGFLEAEPTCATHYGLMLPAGTPFVVTDIDGTLTTADSEFTQQLVNLDHDPAQMQGAQAMVQAWAQKGYAIVYLSARGHRMRAESRDWLDLHGYPTGVLLTADDLVFGETARKHKAIWMTRVQKVLGWQVAAAYGNADSDVHGYGDAGIDKAHTFIIGPVGGLEGTVAIPDNDWTAHTATFVAAQPHAP
jgi:hypothetical protein